MADDFYQPGFSNDYYSFGIGKYMISRRMLQILFCSSHFIFCLRFFSQKSKHFLILWGFLISFFVYKHEIKES